MMADVPISGLPAAGALTGTEEVPVVQSATTKKTTTQDIADLASGSGATEVDNLGTGGEGILVDIALGTLYAKSLAEGSGINLTSDGSEIVISATAQTVTANPNLVLGRLSLTTAVPVTTADVLAATTVYFALYKGNRITLYNGAADVELTIAQLSIAVPATTNTIYDVFVDYNSGTPILVATAWTNDTTRATAIVLGPTGYLVKSGTSTQRYIGLFRTTGSSGQTEDSLVKRYVWNYYNRVARPMQAVDGADSWNYSSATIRQANGNAANQLDFVIGVSEDTVRADAAGVCGNSTATWRTVSTLIGLDSATTKAAGSLSILGSPGAPTSVSSAIFNAPVAVGRHTLSWLEAGAGADTQTWYGDAGAVTKYQSGITGIVWA